MYRKQAYAWPRLAQSELSTQGRYLVVLSYCVVDFINPRKIKSSIIVKANGVIFIR